MDIVVKGRNTEVSERFRMHVAEKLAKIEKLDPKVISVDVECSKERNPRLADQRERVELTIHSRGPVMRAEAAAQDCYAALDVAVRQAGGAAAQARPTAARCTTGPRRRYRSRPRPPPWTPQPAASRRATRRRVGRRRRLVVRGRARWSIREKLHEAAPMNLDQALYEMELVGHDFFLFVDADDRAPSVVYRRRAYDYGVIRLAV